MERTIAGTLGSKCVEQVSNGKSKMKLCSALCSVTLSSTERKERLSTPRFVFWDMILLSCLFLRKKKIQEERLTFPHLPKGIEIQDLLQEGSYHHK